MKHAFLEFVYNTLCSVYQNIGRRNNIVGSKNKKETCSDSEFLDVWIPYVLLRHIGD